jgi:hypothetical protein
MAQGLPCRSKSNQATSNLTRSLHLCNEWDRSALQRNSKLKRNRRVDHGQAGALPNALHSGALRHPCTERDNGSKLYSYLEILQEKSQRLGVTLLDAFKWKDIPSSTYYRTIKGTTELRYETARLVNKAIEELHALRKHREELKEKSRR